MTCTPLHLDDRDAHATLESFGFAIVHLAMSVSQAATPTTTVIVRAIA